MSMYWDAGVTSGMTGPLSVFIMLTTKVQVICITREGICFIHSGR